jgi:hypothetical protein
VHGGGEEAEPVARKHKKRKKTKKKRQALALGHLDPKQQLLTIIYFIRQALFEIQIIN